MQEYKLIACDMDETALTSDLRLTERTIEAMEKALSAFPAALWIMLRKLRRMICACFWLWEAAGLPTKNLWQIFWA